MKHKLLFVIVASLLIVIITNSCSKKTTEPDSQPGRLIFVQGGTFNPENGDGTPSNCYVTLSSFYIDKYEVTQASYQNIMGTNPSIFAGNPKRPVEQVSWLKAIEYCNRRSMKDKLTPCYSYDAYGTDPDNWPAGWNDHTKVSCQWNANGYRLPTEMEWMYAAKGGINSQGYHYSGSSYLNTVARNGNNSEGRTWDVGSLSANELGIYDMCGNVSEWVWDKADYPMSPYPGDNWTNPTGPATGSSRIFRGGGGYNSTHSHCTVWYRSFGGSHGLRCARRFP